MFSDPEKSRLLEAMRRTGTTRLEIKRGDDVLTLGLPLTAPAAVATPVKAVPATIVKSPAMGRFFASGGDDGLAVLCAGDPVSAGQVLGYVASGDVRAPVCAPSAGILGADGPQQNAIIGFGDPLFVVEATS